MKKTLTLIRPLIATGVLVLMMTAAGRGRDPITQAYLAVFGFLAGATSLAIYRRLPRWQIQNSSQAADPGLPSLASFLFVVTFTVAAFDTGRFHWSPALPAAVRIAGLWVLALSGSLQVWAIAVNPFFSPGLSIQAHQRLIATGPYRFMRHPGYLAMLVTVPATAVTLGSLAALLPALTYDLLILNRTVREDGFLRKKLGGYAEYARMVHCRIVPGLW
ncbi:MAG TPA: methyltransferase [Terriglobia bacterium]|nr:methyltransferase [Terriglobia bacterium]